MVVAVIPIKEHSERVPGKNFRVLKGRPLYEYIFETLSQSKYIEEVYVDTDVPHRFDTKKYGIKIIERPEELRGDMVSVNDLLAYDISLIKSSVFLETHVTNPLLKVETVDACIKKFFDKNSESMFTVTPHYKRFWSLEKKPINHNPKELLRSQDLKPVYEDNSCIYLFTRRFFERNKVRMNESSDLFVMNPDEALDIDTEMEWRLVECMM